MAEPGAVRRDAFVWNVSGGEIVLTQEGDAWRVVFSGSGMLFGPPQVLYSRRHDEARMAAWDVMGRVKRVASEEESLAAGRGAANWLKQHGASPRHMH